MAIDIRDRRIARARQLADRYPLASEVLHFYAALLEYQAGRAEGRRGRGVAKDWLVAEIPGLLDWLERAAPAALARSVSDLRQLGAADWRRRFDRAFSDERAESSALDAAAGFVAEALLQPLAAPAGGSPLDRSAGIPGGGVPRMVGDEERTAAVRDEGRCPSCGCLPVVGVLREEGHGTRRSLICCRCEREWAHPRVGCAGCGEEAFVSLPVFTAEQFPHVRIEACDTCRTYLKTVDLSKDGLAVPLVDDLASLPLDLWARAEGYARLKANLLRL